MSEDKKTPDASEDLANPVSRLERIIKQSADLSIRLSRTYEFSVKGERITLDVNDRPAMPISHRAGIEDLKFGVRSFPVKLSSRHQIELPAGITMILGRSGAGKTALALNRISDLNDNVQYIRYGEPLDPKFIERVNARQARLAQHEPALAISIASHLVQNSAESFDVAIVDSIRPLVYMTGGATGKGGVNMTLFADLSFLDVVTASYGKSLIVLVNPLTDDAASYEQIKEVAAGSVSAIIDVKNVDTIAYSSRYHTRKWVTINLPSVNFEERMTSDSIVAGTKATGNINFITR